MPVDATAWNRVAEIIAERLGLHFPDDRLADLRRGFDAAADELAMSDAGACARELLAGRLDEAQLDVIASHLTIGETYFFRGDETFAALAGHVLPALARARRRGEKRLRIWSAACCTGEEAYSLAILLRQVLPDIEDWHISILATDINVRFLRKAIDGVYGKWSFRGTSTGFRDRWFRRRTDGRYEIAEEIRRMVTFAPLNLVDGAIPSLATGTNAMDLVLCRNVLMYFTHDQAARVVAHLRDALRSDGWLVVAPCEVSQMLFADFTPVTFEGAILYRRRTAVAEPRPAVDPASGATVGQQPLAQSRPTPDTHRRPDIRAATRSNTRLRVVPTGPASGQPASSPVSTGPREPLAERDAMARRAHELANRGQLAEALECCDRWISADKMDPRAHYLRAMVLMELGELPEARIALQRSLYLAPDVAMTCFAAGNLERTLGRHAAAALHYRHTLELLDRVLPGAELPQSEGITASQLTALVKDLLLAETG